MGSNEVAGAERRRLEEDLRRERDWRRWGPYLSERQWGTVREDYSAWGACWDHFPHDQARSRVYRWGEDGLLGICDRGCRVCVAVALWNERDGILKERLFGLGGPEGNHCEDVKELYYFLDATPTASYLKALYKYPQEAFPYAQLVEENRRRDHRVPEFELEDTGVFERGYWDVLVEFAKASPDDVLIRYTVANRGPAAATLHVLPTVWLRNTWSWNRTGEGYDARGEIVHLAPGLARVTQPVLGELRFACEGAPDMLFTNNEHNAERLWGASAVATTPYTKDAFHRRVVDGDVRAVDPSQRGTKCAAWYRLDVPPGESRVVRARLAPGSPRFDDFDATFAKRVAEADAYHRATRAAPLSDEERNIVRQADAGLVWSRKFYHFIVEHWFEGDPGHPVPPASRGRNRGWEHLWARDVISMPDPWEYPWFAAWDLAFHCVAMAPTDAAFAKKQLLLLCREWYMHPNGQLPAYEFGFADVNPPVHAWAVWRTFQIEGARDREFLERAFDKCLINFTWWVNRQDSEGHNLFTGGFLGLDNVGVFDRGQPLPGGGKLVQADATGWMAFYCSTMLEMALELAREEAHYGDLALKFFEHFVAIARATNDGLWSDGDGCYHDRMHRPGRAPELVPVRSIVGLVPLFAVALLEDARLAAVPQFRARLNWVFANRPKLGQSITTAPDGRRLLAIPSRERLARILARVLDEREFLSPHGLRSLSRAHADQPYELDLDGRRCEVHYAPGESDTVTFGGNSNWRGPIWFPVNYLMIEALERFHRFYGDDFTVECPTGSGVRMHLGLVARELERRLASLFVPDARGHRPCHGGAVRYADSPAFRDLVLFHEYFHGDDGKGLGASHQTGWTALVANLLESIARSR